MVLESCASLSVSRSPCLRRRMCLAGDRPFRQGPKYPLLGTAVPPRMQVPVSFQGPSAALVGKQRFFGRVFFFSFSLSAWRKGGGKTAQNKRFTRLALAPGTYYVGVQGFSTRKKKILETAQLQFQIFTNSYVTRGEGGNRSFEAGQGPVMRYTPPWGLRIGRATHPPDTAWICRVTAHGFRQSAVRHERAPKEAGLIRYCTCTILGSATSPLRVILGSPEPYITSLIMRRNP